VPPDRPKIRWPPKLRQAIIWQLYQSDAKGIADAELVDKVGYALLSRCASLCMVLAGQVRCPLCGRVFDWGDEVKFQDEPIRCPQVGCGWWTTRREYRASWSKGCFMAHRALVPINTFLEQFGQVRSPREKMVLIDQLIHAFHWDAKANAPVRAVASNLIEGSHWDVVAFLDRLSLGPQTRPDTSQAKQEWRQNVKIMARLRGCRPRVAKRSTSHGQIEESNVDQHH
jgi:hypothetical protein